MDRIDLLRQANLKSDEEIPNAIFDCMNAIIFEKVIIQTGTLYVYNDGEFKLEHSGLKCFIVIEREVGSTDGFSIYPALIMLDYSELIMLDYSEMKRAHNKITVYKDLGSLYLHYGINKKSKRIYDFFDYVEKIRTEAKG